MTWFRWLHDTRSANDARRVANRASKGRSPVFRVLAAPARFLLAPLLMGLLSGYVRGETMDQMLADLMTRCVESLAFWLGSAYVHPTIAWGLVRCLQFGLWALALVIVAGLVAQIHGLTAYLVMSEIARRQGRNASAVDEFIGLSLLLAAAVALARYDAISLLAWLWFCVAYVYVRVAYDPPKGNRLLDWAARLQGSLNNGSVPGGGV